MEPRCSESTFSVHRRGTLPIAKMGRPAHCRDSGPGLASSALGDASRGAGSRPCTRGEHSRKPAAPTPPSGGLSHLLDPIRKAPGYPVAALVSRVLLASPRGFCAGVERAVDTVERALSLYGAPVYVRKQIVHNKHVVDDLERRGAIFVESVHEVPRDATLVFSAHGISPAVRDAAAVRRLNTIDATCPLVTKVHTQARRYAEAGFAIAFIGHAGHEEVEGTFGEAPNATVLVESVEDARTVELPRDRPLAYITQ